jgi:hypothetical protein
MANLAVIVLSFPTVIFTVVFALCLLYWLFVLFGALDLDTFSADGAEGAAKGALEGAAKGAMEGAAKGAADGVADAFDVDGAGADAGDALDGVEGADGFVATVVSALHLRKAPITVVLTLFTVFAWLASTLAMQTIAPAIGLPNFVMSPLVFIAASVVGLLSASLAVRPIAPLFETTKATKNSDLLGKIVVISTGHVSTSFGQAILHDGGAGLTLQVRAEPSAKLKKGDRCVIVDWNDARRGFEVEMLPDSQGRFPNEAAEKATSHGPAADSDGADGADDQASERQRRA